MTENDERGAGDTALADKAISTADIAERGERQAPAEAQPSPAAAGEETSEPLFPGSEAGELRSRWDSIQTAFVDEPRRSVEAADSLVASAMKRLAEIFADERQKLESQWDQGDDVSTEDLRVALRRYRSFFGRLLSM